MIDRILTVGGITLLSRVTGFLRDIMLAAILCGARGRRVLVALRLPNHFRAISGEGAFNAAFVPAYARIREANGAAPSQCSPTIFSRCCWPCGVRSPARSLSCRR